MRSPSELAQVFRDKHLKLTPQRQLLFSLLHQNPSHPTAESLYEIASKKMPGISLRTIYQTLGELVEMGELQLVDVGIGATRFDPNIGDHHHFVCESCRAIHDVDILTAPKMSLRNSGGFAVDEVGVIFRGRCNRCNHKQKVRSPGSQAKNKASN